MKTTRTPNLIAAAPALVAPAFAQTSDACAARYEVPALLMIAGRFAARSAALFAATSQTIT